MSDPLYRKSVLRLAANATGAVSTSYSSGPVASGSARRSALALMECERRGLTTGHILSEDALHNAMAVHAAFGTRVQ